MNQHGLRGAGIWALGYDGARPELWNAIREVHHRQDRPDRRHRDARPRAAEPGLRVSWSGRRRRHDQRLRRPGLDRRRPVDRLADRHEGDVRVWTGLDGHGYAFRVRARDPKGNTSAWNVPATTARPAGPDRRRVRAWSGSTACRSEPPGDSAAEDRHGRTEPRHVAISAGRAGRRLDLVPGRGTARPRGRPSGRDPGLGRRQAATARPRRPTKTPNATRVAAYLGHLGFGGAGAASIGTGVPARSPIASSRRTATGPGHPRGRLDERGPFDGIFLRVFRADGTLVGGVPVRRARLRRAGSIEMERHGRRAGKLPTGGISSASSAAGRGRLLQPRARPFRASALARSASRSTPSRRSSRRPPSRHADLAERRRDPRQRSASSIAATGATSWTFGVAPVTGSTVGAGRHACRPDPAAAPP